MRHLTPGDPLARDIIRLIAHVTAPLGDASMKLQRQAEVAAIIRYSATMLDVSMPSDISVVDLPDGPVPGTALVYDSDQLIGELLVWVRDGRLIGLEQAWYTDDPPESWPPPEMVRVS